MDWNDQTLIGALLTIGSFIFCLALIWVQDQRHTKKAHAEAKLRIAKRRQNRRR